jgi:ATP-binding cassette subfamily F protein 3
MQIKITNASFGFGGETLLENFSFEVNSHDKIAIIGRNGSGKTTILKMLTGEIELSQPENSPPVFVKIGSPVISSLKQMTFDSEDVSLEDEIVKCYSNILTIKNKLDDIQKKLETDPSDKLVASFSKLHDEFETLGGYSYSSEMSKALSSFGFSEADRKKKLSEFSGGQKTKIAFIKLILSKPDILILDEPTNHLDIKAVSWLEGFVAAYKKAVVVVSHDRTFLDNTINIIYELEHKKLTRYVGNYSKYIETKNANYESALKHYEAQQREIADINAFIERFRYKATKAAAVQSRVKYLEKMEILPPPEKADGRAFHSQIKPNIESGSEVLSCTNLKIGHIKNEPIACINLKILRGDRLGIIGGNGLGKSTFLQTITSKIEAISGHFKFGYHVEYGYFEQLASKYSSSKTILEEFQNLFPDLSDREARSALGAFLFSGRDVLKEMRALSGGELVRFELAKILQKKPNLLILDEPTNHMDIVSKETLESMLLNFAGTIIFVSHDRYFTSKIATKLLIFEQSEVKFFDGTLKEYNDPYSKQIKENQNVTKPPKPEKIEYPIDYDDEKEIDPILQLPPYLASKEKSKIESRLKKIEKNSLENENKLKKLNEDFVDPEIASDFKKLMEIQGEMEETQKTIDKLADEWLTLNETLQKLENLLVKNDETKSEMNNDAMGEINDKANGETNNGTND